MLFLLSHAVNILFLSFILKRFIFPSLDAILFPYSVLPSAVQWRVARRYIWAVRGSRHTTRAATQLADHNTTSDAANTPPHTATLVQVGYTRVWTNGSLQARVSKRWPEGQVGADGSWIPWHLELCQS